ncbi:unnamed protein product [Phytophthora fragariaefolia]|uniref:Unnamed protein product n=1 Tax=Phytophthora fragariaefolia TaxID=1490495 RepID=A0A9W7D6F8_9STRA|nr:unnamed protein product [Phytophthora fragariaefolia]
MIPATPAAETEAPALTLPDAFLADTFVVEPELADVGVLPSCLVDSSSADSCLAESPPDMADHVDDDGAAAWFLKDDPVAELGFTLPGSWLSSEEVVSVEEPELVSSEEAVDELE